MKSRSHKPRIRLWKGKYLCRCAGVTGIGKTISESIEDHKDKLKESSAQARRALVYHLSSGKASQ